MLGYSVLLTLGAGLLFGLAPALQATRPDIAPTLKDENTGGGVPRRITLRGSLVAAQVAVSLVLLLAAGLFLRSFRARLDIDPGFGHQPAALLTVQLDPQTHTPEATRAFYRTLLDRFRAVPGVSAVGMTYLLQLTSTGTTTTDVNVDGIQPPAGADFYEIDKTVVDPGFFDAAGVTIVSGRAFDERDTPGGARTAIVSQAFASLFWPGQDAVGRGFRSGDSRYTVVGVAQDTKVRTLGEEPRPYVYFPYSQLFQSQMTVVARTRGPADRAGGGAGDAGAADGPRAHHLPGGDDGSPPGGDAPAAAAGGLDRHGVRGAGAAAGLDRTVRGGELRGGGAEPRSRDPDGPRRPARGRSTAAHGERPAAGGSGRRLSGSAWRC